VLLEILQCGRLPTGEEGQEAIVTSFIANLQLHVHEQLAGELIESFIATLRGHPGEALLCEGNILQSITRFGMRACLIIKLRLQNFFRYA